MCGMLIALCVLTCLYMLARLAQAFKPQLASVLTLLCNVDSLARCLTQNSMSVETHDEKTNPTEVPDVPAAAQLPDQQ